MRVMFNRARVFFKSISKNKTKTNIKNAHFPISLGCVCKLFTFVKRKKNYIFVDI